MDNLLFLFGVTVVIFGIAAVAYTLAWLLTEFFKPMFKVKPFNCRQCLAFWFTFLLNGVFAWIITPYLLRRGVVADMSVAIYGVAGVGFLVGLLNYFFIKNKFKIYD